MSKSATNGSFKASGATESSHFLASVASRPNTRSIASHGFAIFQEACGHPFSELELRFFSPKTVELPGVQLKKAELWSRSLYKHVKTRRAVLAQNK